MRKTVSRFLNGVVFRWISSALAAVVVMCCTIAPAMAQDAGGVFDEPAPGTGTEPKPPAEVTPPPIVPSDEGEKTPPATGGENVTPPAAGATTGAGEQQAPIILPNEDGTVDIVPQDVDIRLVLSALDSQMETVHIVPSKGVSGTVTLNLTNTSIQDALTALKHAAGLEYKREDKFLYVYTVEEYQQMKQMMQQTVTEVFELYYLTAVDAKQIIQDANLLSPAGKVAMTKKSEGDLRDYSSTAGEAGGGGSQVKTGGNAYAGRDRLIIRDYKDNLEKIVAVLDKLDVRPEVVLVEATILSASLADDSSLGVDLQILSESHRFPNNAGDGDIWPFAIPGDRSNDYDLSRASMSLGTTFGSNVPTTGNEIGSLSFGIVANNVAAFITAMEAITDTTVVANPKMLILNKMQGTIHVGTKLGYIASVTQTSTAETAEVKFLNVGTVLLVRPHICKNGFIRMEIQPKDSTGLLRTYGTFTVPEENVTQVTTNMMVRDGHTIVIGGLFRESIKRQRGQVPAIGNMPLIGPLFRNRLDDTLREEVMLLLTPHIIHNAEDEILTKELQDRGERIRLGARKGISWFSSRSMADTFLLNARRHLAGGNIDRALWNVDMALACEPTRHEAVALKNRLRTRASWTRKPDYLATQSVVKRMILANQDAIDVPIPPSQSDQNQKKLEALLKKIEEEERKSRALNIPKKAETRPATAPGSAAGAGETKPDAGGQDKPAAVEEDPAKAGADSSPVKAPEPPVLEAPGSSSTIKEDVKIPSDMEPDFKAESKGKGDNVSSGEAVTDDEKNYYFIIDM